MPVTTIKLESDDLTIHDAWGKLTFEEAFIEIKIYYEHEKPTKNVLWDLTKVTELAFTAEEIEKNASFKSRFDKKRSTGKTAIVAKKPFSFSFSRMFKLFSQMNPAPHDVMVFRNRNQAETWLKS